MYGRPLDCKFFGGVLTKGLGAVMYTACLCGTRGRWP